MNMFSMSGSHVSLWFVSSQEKKTQETQIRPTGQDTESSSVKYAPEMCNKTYNMISFFKNELYPFVTDTV